MRIFAIGDIHGGLKALIQVLNKIEVKDEDTLIFVGDYVDGWSESAQVIQFLIELSQKINCIFIKGNHDVWCEEWLRSGEVNQTWYIHGGKETMDSYQGFSDADKKAHLELFESMPLYHLDDENRLFLHAGFTSMHGVTREVFKNTLYFDRTLWEMALTLDKSIDKDSNIYPNRLKHYKEIFIGHTPTTNFDCDVPMNAANVWNIDTGAAFTGKIAAVNVNTKEVFQSDNLPGLYPNEKGRNK
ncbi:serine/threonine protein phosphatase [Algibacter amylolyticus]|uniref:Serine/threonine protein phosphatase n=1 Tax=Algibacter amylolyticus TaxID=1608400 RepID=A0A5M7BIN5_9FLAO|nr:metallophosphoesterase family protein [Algibacter amylolyticus]KAA5828058.1 serine/threonine protein phosphatase [Algibacter amylolyticus]MBB5267306.1 serine/threonine protein phosphatase 1 [Algibacter amylolyticus]TSJ82303.1 serine/threonine protein phosphatase [Algibacter amylolyticus]